MGMLFGIAVGTLALLALVAIVSAWIDRSVN